MESLDKVNSSPGAAPAMLSSGSSLRTDFDRFESFSAWSAGEVSGAQANK